VSAAEPVRLNGLILESGAVSGPARNGAPCRSATDNDSLEGLQLRIIDRSAAP
jgi:hypothetical protein